MRISCRSTLRFCYPKKMRFSHCLKTEPRLLMLALVFALVTGCSWIGEEQDLTKDWSAVRLYTAAKERLENKDYEQAIDYYEKLESRYPFGPHSQQDRKSVV